MSNLGNLFWIIIFVLIPSCSKRYIGTSEICRNKLYVEIYEVNPAGIDASYITDSTNFRIFVGKFDPESNRYKFRCDGDSLYIEKFKNRDKYVSDTVEILIETRVINLTDIKKQHKFEK